MNKATNDEKLIVYFDTVPINPAVDPRGGYAMKMKEQQIVSGNSVFEEVVLTKTLPFSAELLAFAFECVLTTMADRVSRDCRPRKIGKHLKAAAYIRGRLENPYDAFDPKVHSCAIVFTSLSGVTKTANTDNYVRFVNSKTGTRVTIDRIVYEGCVDSSQIATIMRGKGIAVTGLNCQWLEGDTCTLVWKDAEGAEQTANIVPLSSTVTEMHFAWPEALADVPAGSELQMRFLTRGGVEESSPQLNNKTVTLIEGEVLPSVTKVATTGKDGIVRGEAFEATGENLGFNFATDHVSVTWTEGGTRHQAAMVPLSATAEKITFNSCVLFDALPAGTELIFAFELGGKTVEKATTLIDPEGPYIRKPTEQMALSSTGSLAFTGKELPTDVSGWGAASPVCELREGGEIVDMIELGPVADFDDLSATGFTLLAAGIVSGLFTEKERELVPGQEYELRFTATIDGKSLAVPFTAHG